MNQTGTAFSYINWANFFYISPENHGRRSIDRGGWCNEERKEALIIFVQLSRQTQARKSVISSGHREPHDLPRVGSPRSGPRWRARTEQSSSERSWARTSERLLTKLGFKFSSGALDSLEPARSDSGELSSLSASFESLSTKAEEWG